MYKLIPDITKLFVERTPQCPKESPKSAHKTLQLRLKAWWHCIPCLFHISEVPHYCFLCWTLLCQNISMPLHVATEEEWSYVQIRQFSSQAPCGIFFLPFTPEIQALVSSKSILTCLVNHDLHRIRDKWMNLKGERRMPSHLYLPSKASRVGSSLRQT